MTGWKVLLSDDCLLDVRYFHIVHSARDYLMFYHFQRISCDLIGEVLYFEFYKPYVLLKLYGLSVEDQNVKNS